MVYFWAAVAGLVDVGVGGDVVGFCVGGCCGVDGFGEVDEEAIFLDVDFFYFEWCDA